MLSDKVKKYRCERKLSKMELSRVSGISHRTIEFLENGKIDNPTLKTLKALSNAFGVDIEDLIK